ncbi:MAG TPA: NDP-sugar synthase [Mycobacteriales bacterium]|nr:NDP-sugar synthase [Mycobacteriales bacterium]
MEAVVLVGGQGTRLQPLTLRTPKPMLPFAGAPFLEHQLARLRDSGVDHIVLATSYRPEVFHEHFGSGKELGVRIDFVTETEPLGTGGGIRHVTKRLESGPDDPVLVLNGDVLSGHDLRAQLELHRRREAAVTLHLVEVDDARAFGCVPTDSHSRVTAFIEKSDSPVTNRINAGCYVFTRRVIDSIPEGRPVSVERDTFPGLLDAGEILLGYVENAYWLDVGTPAAFVQASRDVVTGVLGSPSMPGAPGEALILDEAIVHAGAVVTGGSVIGPRARVDAGAQVSGSVLGDGVHVQAGANVVDSLVGRRAVIGQRSVVTSAVIGEGAMIGANNELGARIRIWNDVTIQDGAVRFSPLP